MKWLNVLSLAKAFVEETSRYMDFERKKEIAMGHMTEWNGGVRVSKEIWEYLMWHHSELFVDVDSNDAVVKRNCLSLLKDAFREAKRELMDEEEVEEK